MPGLHNVTHLGSPACGLQLFKKRTFLNQLLTSTVCIHQLKHVGAIGSDEVVSCSHGSLPRQSHRFCRISYSLFSRVCVGSMGRSLTPFSVIASIHADAVVAAFLQVITQLASQTFIAIFSAGSQATHGSSGHGSQEEGCTAGACETPRGA